MGNGSKLKENKFLFILFLNSNSIEPNQPTRSSFFFSFEIYSFFFELIWFEFRKKDHKNGPNNFLLVKNNHQNQIEMIRCTHTYCGVRKMCPYNDKYFYKHSRSYHLCVPHALKYILSSIIICLF